MPTPHDAHDLVAYPAHAYPSTHPNNLAVIALLHGLEPAPLDHGRVLEVGCNAGANLISMAYTLPDSTFVGFDLAALPIARGQQVIQELGLSNIQLLQADIMDVGPTLGSFDYIIAHGVYAWVPEPVRAALLALCREHLAPNGIAFLSYNALPGGHVKNLLRDLLQLGMTGPEDPLAAVSQAFQLLYVIAENRPKDDPLRSILEKEIKRLEKRGPNAVFHDELSGAHRPVSFQEFMTQASAHDLQYLSESTLPPPDDPCYNSQIVKVAESLAQGDPLLREQVLDTFRMRMYRETLLCHAGHTLSSDLSFEYADRLYLASPAIVSAGSHAASRIFTLADGNKIESHHPPTVALLELLIATWPATLSLPHLMERLAPQGIAFDAEFLKLLLRLVVSRYIDLHAWVAPVANTIATHPEASAVARQQARTSTEITTLFHTSLRLDDPLVRQLILLLDGTRDAQALLDDLCNQSPELPRQALAEGLETTLRMLNRSGVLYRRN